MENRILGRTGLKVSPLCLGSMQFGWTADEAASLKILDAAYVAGIHFIDTADVYSRWAQGNPGGVSETIIGNWIRQNHIPRESLVIATKVASPMGEGPNNSGLSRVHIFHAVEASLRRLQTDYIDLYQTHWPDLQTPVDVTLSAMTDLVRQGKVRYLGCSNYRAWQLMQALWASERLNLARFDSLQPHYNLVHRAEFERELADVCRAYALGVIPYSPLAGGFLTGKYQRDGVSVESELSERKERAGRYFNEQNWALLDLFKEIGQAHGGGSISQAALAWQLHNPLITAPIIGPRTLEQLKDNLGAVEMKLSPEEIEKINEASKWEE